MNWGKLLDDAICILKKTDRDNNSWSLGGGTVLMFNYNTYMNLG